MADIELDNVKDHRDLQGSSHTEINTVDRTDDSLDDEYPSGGKPLILSLLAVGLATVLVGYVSPLPRSTVSNVHLLCVGRQLRHDNNTLDHRYIQLPRRCGLVWSCFPPRFGDLATLSFLVRQNCLLSGRSHLRPGKPGMRSLPLESRLHSRSRHIRARQRGCAVWNKYHHLTCCASKAATDLSRSHRGARESCHRYRAFAGRAHR
jgi:hypothetical protein